MARYEYDFGPEGRFDIWGSMKSPPPQDIWYSPMGEAWLPRAPGETKDHGDWIAGTRVWTVPAGKVHGDGATRYTNIPVSHSIHRRYGGQVVNRYGHQVQEFADGTHATLDGKPIIDSHSTRERHAKHAGVQFEEPGVTDDSDKD